ncbi:MAG: DUF3459 domain-containing protein [Armatimonadia bacterium]|nr:DUF3459 domain-containing protein [Armatimonadia bacterium]
MIHLSLLTLTLCAGDPAALALRFDDDGRLAALAFSHLSAGVAGPDFRLDWAGRGEEPVSGWPLVEMLESDDGVTVRRALGPWELELRYTSPAAWCVARLAVLTNVSSESQEILQAGYPLAGGERHTYRIAPAFCLEHETGTLVAAQYGATDPAGVRGTDGGAEHLVRVRARLEPGESVALDPQYLWLAEDGAELAPPRLQRWYRLVGLTPPADRPEWAEDAVIYSTHPGGHIDSWFQDIGGFANLQRQLEYIDWLGANTLWLLPIYTYSPEAKLGVGCPYGPMDFYEIEPALGGEDAARRFVRAAHERDMRVLIDIVPHGGSDPHVEGQPEWRLRSEDGSFKQVFGWTCDYAAEGWQDVMADVVATWVRRLDVDGYRIDVSEGMGENLGPDVKRPSYSARGGPVEMLRRMREAARSEKSSALMYPEGFDHLPWLPHTDISYGFRLFFWLKDQQSAVAGDSAEWARLLTQYLREEEAQVPEGSLIARPLTNHDMDRDHGHVTHSFGVGVSQALMAAMVASRGVPFVYQEQERGSAVLYQRLLRTREALPELRRGDVRYGVADAPDGVFTSWRWTDAGATLVAVSFRPETLDARLTLDPDELPLPGGPLDVVDAWTGAELAQDWTAGTPLTVDAALPPYRPAFITLRPAGDPVPIIGADRPGAREYGGAPEPEGIVMGVDPAARQDPPAGAVEVSSQGEVHTARMDPALLDDPSGRSLGVEIAFPRATHWMANTESGLLEGMHVPRHRAWRPATGYGRGPGLRGGIHIPSRIWDSGLHRLHPERGFVAVAHAGGCTRIELPELPPGVTAHLDDGSSAGDDEVLKLVVLATDPAPIRVDHGPFAVVGGPAVQVSPPELDLRISAATWPELLAGAAASVYETAARRPVQVAGDTPASHNSGMLYLPEPGAMRYDLEVPIAGEWHLWLELRRSERSAGGTDLDDAYRVTIGDQPVTYEWLGRTRHSTGNSFVDWVAVGPIRLDSGEARLTVHTLTSWCAVGERVLLTPDPGWTP